MHSTGIYGHSWGDFLSIKYVKHYTGTETIHKHTFLCTFKQEVRMYNHPTKENAAPYIANSTLTNIVRLFRPMCVMHALYRNAVDTAETVSDMDRLVFQGIMLYY